MILRKKAEALIDLIDQYGELTSEKLVMESNTEFPFTHSEIQEVQE